MPRYDFQHPETGEVKEVILSMNEPHVYSEGGVEWIRIFSVPQAAMDTKINPFDSKKFAEKTQRKDTVGALWDRSKEWSEKRQKIHGGVDPVKENYLKDYSKKRQGKEHPSEKIKNYNEVSKKVSTKKKKKE